jgi:hypothetical protein
LLLISNAGVAFEQSDTSAQPAESTNPVSAPAEDSFWNRFWVSGQANFIRQQHGSFDAEYSGPNSLRNDAEHATSRVLTLYTGFRITKNLEILADVESAGGAGISDALGLAGFTNVDVVRNPTLGTAPYLARAMLHLVVPLSKETEEATRNPLSLFATLPVRRLEFRLGKMSTVDIFDNNTVGSDSHTQFMNWAAVNNASFDYAADTRGYTYGLYMEYDDKWGAIRLGEMLMPTVANGITLDWNVARAGGTNLEVEVHPPLFKEHATIVRFLNFVNRANMGSYREAINGYLAGETTTPDITAYRSQGRIKYGFGLNVEQYITKQWEAYGRLGWADGRNEDFAYTETDRTASIGTLLYGNWWHRPNDKLGEAFIANGISGDHARYLQLGGLGFILGDGGLSYGLEKIFETFYTAHVWGGISAAVDWQYVTNPGYNMARGPVSVVSFRLHLEGGIPFDKIAARH